ncbi:fungal transcription factor regulatory middle homology region [Aspergillus parasiticus SU-1]|uniref:Fungal transcription factor regulatory middle homology region n=1 Tax=Aspergillus parasiticus (strain ATCC 56775 / NRRL 5862 / SRRC 143 / SU-1) TaxID=1403190 RepID=A0A0F0I511_ASPPU|nr:fungal transcription factor regulatory middle homology region [Aspergillus parasiticus SU-1]
MDSPRRNRNRAACRRCQRRKIRCDGQTPRCGSCQKASTPCINDGKQLVQRSYIASMEKRIQWLETLVKKSCPNVDLGAQPRDNLAQEEEPVLVEEHEETSILSPQREFPASEEQGLGQSRQQYQGGPHHPLRSISRMESRQAHEIGLVSLSPGGEPRYIGPSSGYFFANLVFSSAGRHQKRRNAANDSTGSLSGESTALAAEILHTPASLPPRRETAAELSAKYFETIHIIYPFLHQPSHMSYIDQMYSSEDVSPIVAFQVYMVMAIAATDLSRRSKVRLPAEGYYATAMQHFSNMSPDGTLGGLQSLLLLMVYGFHNPSCGINIWNLNYQCLASLIDLGLQRDIRNTPSLKISLLEQEMRTRVFWVVYTFDRTIGTMMGRPVGIRDEACDLRLPMDISDLELMRPDAQERSPEQSPSHISFGIHLFKAARLNSEIKYVMHSISREPPAYAYPPIRDIFIWQREMLERLQTWKAETPHTDNINNMSAKLCEIKYHEMMILVLRPSPAIPDPSEDSSILCFRHAMELLESFRELYKHDSLQYSRLVVHSIFLGTLVVLHSIWKLPDISTNIQIDELSKNITTALNILSSIGEYWLEAQRARDCIDDISGVTMRRLLKTRASGESTATLRLRSRIRTTNNIQQSPNLSSQLPLGQNATSQQQELIDLDTNPAGFGDFNTGFPDATVEQLDSLQLFGDSAFEETFGLTGVPDFDGLMWELFNLS